MYNKLCIHIYIYNLYSIYYKIGYTIYTHFAIIVMYWPYVAPCYNTVQAYRNLLASARPASRPSPPPPLSGSSPLAPRWAGPGSPVLYYSL